MTLSNGINKVYFSAHLRTDYPVFFKRMKGVLEQYGISVELLQDTEDYWCRDYMPIQTDKDRFVKYHYFPDYLNKPKKLKFITNVDKPLRYLDIPTDHVVDLSDVIMDGGNVVKTPYHVIMTEKIFIANSTIDKNVLLSKLENAFQSEVIIMPWANRRKDPCGHTDGMVRYVKGHELLMDNYSHFAPRIGKRIHNILEEKGYTVHELAIPYAYDESWAYINFLQTSKVIILPKFGLVADDYALRHIQSLFNVPVVQVPSPDLIKGYGGAFNCLSWNISC